MKAYSERHKDTNRLLQHRRNFIDTFKAQPITTGDLVRALVNYNHLAHKLYHYSDSLISQAISLLNFYFPEGSPSPPATLLSKVPQTITNHIKFTKWGDGLPPDPEPALPQETVLLRLRGLFAGVEALCEVIDEVQLWDLFHFLPILYGSNMGFRVTSAYMAARCEDDMDRMVGAVQRWLSESNIDQYESIFQELQWLMEPDSVTIQVGVDRYRRGNNPRRRMSYHSK